MYGTDTTVEGLGLLASPGFPEVMPSSNFSSSCLLLQQGSAKDVEVTVNVEILDLKRHDKDNCYETLQLLHYR